MHLVNDEKIDNEEAVNEMLVNQIEVDYHF